MDLDQSRKMGNPRIGEARPRGDADLETDFALRLLDPTVAVKLMSFERDGKASFEETMKTLRQLRSNLIRVHLSRARTLFPTGGRAVSLRRTERVSCSRREKVNRLSRDDTSSE